VAPHLLLVSRIDSHYTCTWFGVDNCLPMDVVVRGLRSLSNAEDVMLGMRECEFLAPNQPPRQ
jgi:hypothetical protein